MNQNSTQNLRDIYNLLDKLCKNFSANRHKEILKTVTSMIADVSQHSFLSNIQFDESIIVGKIKNHLQNKSQTDLSVFMNLHEELSTITEDKFRSSILTLLLYLSDMENKLPNAINFTKDNESVFNVPFSTIQRNRSGESTAHFDQIYKGINSRTSFNSSSIGPDTNWKIINFRRGMSTHSSDTNIMLPQDIATKDIENASKTLNEELVQAAIYSLTGKPGKYLKKDVTGEFKLDIKARNLNAQEATILLRLAEIGRTHNDIKKYTDLNSEFFLCGLFGQGFISELENELTQFYGLVATLQENLNSQRQSFYGDWNKCDVLTLTKLLSWLSEPQKRLRNLNEILISCKDLKGGAIVSVLHGHLYNGDPNYRLLVKSLLKAACHPLQAMLSCWLLDGEIKDPHNEFFIEEIKEVTSDRLWHHKYRVMNARLPSFISKLMARKILVAGKSINFLREVCEDKSPIKGREDLKLCFENNIEDLFGPVPDSKLHDMINAAYLNTSKKVLDIALGQYRLLEHLQAMRKYLLLGQGDFIGLLMESLKDELDRPAKDLYQHALFSIVASSIRATSQFDDAEILEHLDVKLVHAIDGDKGWDIFTLQYTVHGPLATILELNMARYQELFKPLWKAKHVEFVLSNIWKDQMLNSKPLRGMQKAINPVTYRLHLYTSEMIHFIHQMQYYILFEVIECSWATFIKKVQSAKALDDILEAHEQFLAAVRVGTFLDSETKQTLYLHLDIVYDSIMKLEEWQKQFYELSFKELAKRKDFEDNIVASEKTGEYGITAEKRLERDEEIKMFEQIVSTYKKSLINIGNEYEKYVNDFLLMLTSSKDHNLQLFGIRLDFNEYYKKRDNRLKHPLTFEQMRLSGINASGIFARNSFMNTSKYINDKN